MSSTNCGEIILKTEKTYPAKLLLFGEYTIIDGGAGLTIPFPRYSGQWKSEGKPIYDLGEFFDFISDLHFIDADKVSFAKEQNWFFDANIPLGYGLGSSGCLCAACYDSFGNVSQNYLEIKHDLASMEAFFHGTSSGLDPLTIYLNKPLHLNKGNIELVLDPVATNNVLVLDSGIHRNAKSFIKIFNEHKSTDTAFMGALQTLNTLNTRAIRGLRTNDLDFELLLEISALQMEFFKPMIPESMEKVWHTGLSSGNYAIKLSGAGGGGCFLVFKKEKEQDLDLGFPLISI